METEAEPETTQVADSKVNIVRNRIAMIRFDLDYPYMFVRDHIGCLYASVGSICIATGHVYELTPKLT